MKSKPECFTVVGSKGRSAYMAMHPDCWEKPYMGIVLSELDPIAWRGTLAFPGYDPDPVEVAEHVLRNKKMGLDDGDTVPVMWYFVNDCGVIKVVHNKVYWEKFEDLEKYDEILAWWQNKKDEEIKRRSLEVEGRTEFYCENKDA